MDLRLRFLFFLPLLAVGLVSFVVVRSQQGEGAALAARQQSAQALTPHAVERVVRVAPDPVTGKGGLSASCSSLGSGELRNPWRCTIHYRSGRVIRYRVVIHADGSFRGDQEILSFQGRTHPDTGQVSGCCITIP